VDEQISNDLIYKVNQFYTRDGAEADVKTVVVHPGPKHWKEVSITRFVDPETGDLGRPKFQGKTWRMKPHEDGEVTDFTETKYSWGCEGEEEIEAIRLLLNDEFQGGGRYRLVRRGSEIGRLAEAIARGDVAASDVAQLLQLAGRKPDFVKALAASENGGLLAEAVELQRRRDQLTELRRIVEDPSSTERKHIHPQLKKMGWIFGGKYMGDAARTQLTAGEVLDIPLLRPDGSLHVVELKGAKVSELVKQHRGAARPQVVAGQREEVPLIVGLEVHKAVGQVMNYLCQLDEDRDRILTKFKIDARRASATVLIGHPKFEKDYSKEEIASAFRIYNSHHARIEVMHYEDLIESAERALALDDMSSEVVSSMEAESVRDYDPWSDDDSQYSDEPPF
jgi:antiviral defense system Shedu protein SduA